MIDKPIPAKIIMTLKETGNREDFIGFEGTLYRQNLIFNEPMVLRQNKNRLEYTVTFRDTNSFRNWKKNPQVVKHWQLKFIEQLTKIPRTVKEVDIDLEIAPINYCTCGQTEYYILRGRYLRDNCNELNCSHCLKEVSYSIISPDIELENWQCHYQRVYMNWFATDFLEKQAIRELTNYKKGKLNLKGEEVRKELSEYFKKPVYLLYFEKDAYNGHRSKTCLLCGSEGVPSGLTFPNRICKECNTVFGEDEEVK